ncbi:hypothetical protein M885DRAFT_300340 [Pelagophyceae sp. CCMP2097]|nr:hypothetical protein M885DRAFT_300340 [Pelagophyceae sp. CCMP2097]
MDLHLAAVDCVDGRDVAVGDLDLDGFADIVAPCKQSGDVRAYLGDGAGGFRVARGAFDKLTLPRSVDVADVDGDGDLDVLVGCSSPGLHLFSNELRGPHARAAPPPGNLSTFHHARLEAPGMLNRVRFADVNGDGLLDLLWVAEEKDELGWFENLGRGEAPRFVARRILFPVGDGSLEQKKLHSFLVFYDVVQAAAARPLRGRLEPRLNESRPRPAHVGRAPPFSGAPPRLLLLGNSAPPTLVSLDPLRPEEVAFLALELRQHLGAIGACAADVDGDGRTDLVVSYKFHDSIAWYRQLQVPRFDSQAPNATFSGPHGICPPGDCDYVTDVVCVDVDGDVSSRERGPEERRAAVRLRPRRRRVASTSPLRRRAATGFSYFSTSSP